MIAYVHTVYMGTCTAHVCSTVHHCVEHTTCTTHVAQYITVSSYFLIRGHSDVLEGEGEGTGVSGRGRVKWGRESEWWGETLRSDSNKLSGAGSPDSTTTGAGILCNLGIATHSLKIHIYIV